MDSILNFAIDRIYRIIWIFLYSRFPDKTGNIQSTSRNEVVDNFISLICAGGEDSIQLVHSGYILKLFAERRLFLSRFHPETVKLSRSSCQSCRNKLFRKNPFLKISLCYLHKIDENTSGIRSHNNSTSNKNRKK